MSFTMLLAAGLVAVLAGGVAASLLVPRPPPDEALPRRALPAPVFWAAAVPLIAFVFYAAGGYVWLAGIAGQAAAQRVHLVLNLAAPVLGGAVCLVYAITSRARLRYVLLCWLCLVLAVVGAMCVGISRM